MNKQIKLLGMAVAIVAQVGFAMENPHLIDVANNMKGALEELQAKLLGLQKPAAALAVAGVGTSAVLSDSLSPTPAQGSLAWVSGHPGSTALLVAGAVAGVVAIYCGYQWYKKYCLNHLLDALMAKVDEYKALPLETRATPAYRLTDTPAYGALIKSSFFSQKEHAALWDAIRCMNIALACLNGDEFKKYGLVSVGESYATLRVLVDGLKK